MKPFRGSQINKTHPLAKGLVGCWIFNEDTGDLIFDLSGHNNHITNYGATWISESLNFDGVDDNAKADPFDFSTAGTMFFRAKVDTTTDLEELMQDIAGGYWDMDIYDNNLRTRFHDGSFKTYTYDINSNVFYNYLITWDTSIIKHYLDGIEKNSVAFAGLNSNADGIVIGSARGNNEYLPCEINFLYVYNRLLTSRETTLLNNNPYCIFESGISSGVLYAAAEEAGIPNAGAMLMMLMRG